MTDAQTTSEPEVAPAAEVTAEKTDTDRETPAANTETAETSAEAAEATNDDKTEETKTEETSEQPKENAEEDKPKPQLFSLSMEIEMRIEVLKEEEKKESGDASSISADAMASMAPISLEDIMKENKGPTEEKKDEEKEERKEEEKEEQKEEEKEDKKEEEKINYGPIKVTLVDGTCECFGAELVPNKEYVFNPGMIFALYTWSGCQLSIVGGAFKHTITPSPVMRDYMTLHARLENYRETARAKSFAFSGPRVIICGPTDCGKSTLCKMLLNWAVRAGMTGDCSGRRPLFVDTDVGQNGITVPGCIAACAVDTVTPIGVREARQRQSELPLNQPLCLWFGATSPDADPKFFIYLLEVLASYCVQKLNSDEMCRNSGCIVNTCGWVNDFGLASLMETIYVFNADVVVSLGQDDLCDKIKAEMGRAPAKFRRMPTFLSLKKSDGVVTRSKEKRRKARDDRIQEYFKGEFNTLNPYCLRNLSFSDFHVYEASAHNGSLQVSEIPASSLALGTLLAVMNAERPEEIIKSSVAGFCLVQEINTSKKTISILLPCAGALPSQLFLKGSY